MPTPLLFPSALGSIIRSIQSTSTPILFNTTCRHFTSTSHNSTAPPKIREPDWAPTTSSYRLLKTPPEGLECLKHGSIDAVSAPRLTDRLRDDLNSMLKNGGFGDLDKTAEGDVIIPAFTWKGDDATELEQQRSRWPGIRLGLCMHAGNTNRRLRRRIKGFHRSQPQFDWSVRQFWHNRLPGGLDIPEDLQLLRTHKYMYVLTCSEPATLHETEVRISKFLDSHLQSVKLDYTEQNSPT